ncbi:hypothetical protein L593_04360 [Salinarchaeum sp. Harcht-Bsk1]|uniref:hypothetical protein n=1 Tax=Salinarchaeum sp. Harcht-Bsk1 TaxID=1333523 RepID=UPI0003424700|nr:hypothetical protein [Salinarchaeum sp. Harcht-Bsk1]AGN00823.1 hypothetical protein L593_04360 [Salinarchaeum sp. Harcht-Bsk1]
MQRRTYVAGIASALTAGLAGCSALGSGGDGDDGSDGSGTDNTDGNNSHGDGGTGDDSGGGNGTDPGGDPPSPSLVNGSFEDGLEGWTVGKDLPPKPGEDSGTVDHDVTTSSDTGIEASDGETVLKFTLSGRADDGTLWVEQEVDFADAATVELDVYSEQESFNEIGQIAVFAGEKPEGGLVEEDFNREHPTENHQGWKTFRYDVADLTGTGTLAVGLNIVWETEIVRLYDDVQLVTIEE